MTNQAKMRPKRPRGYFVQMQPFTFAICYLDNQYLLPLAFAPLSFSLPSSLFSLSLSPVCPSD